jgi:hypothetical protein
MELPHRENTSNTGLLMANIMGHLLFEKEKSPVIYR